MEGLCCAWPEEARFALDLLSNPPLLFLWYTLPFRSEYMLLDLFDGRALLFTFLVERLFVRATPFCRLLYTFRWALLRVAEP